MPALFEIVFVAGFGTIAGWLLAVVGDLHPLNQQLNRILMNQAELAAALNAANDQIAKVRAEQETLAAAQRASIDALTARVKELTDIIDAGTVTEALANAVAAVQRSLQEFDDTIPDAPPAEPPAS